MKYFGKKSLSSFLSGFLHGLWYVVLVGSIITAVIGSLILLYLSCGDHISTEIFKGGANSFCLEGKDEEDWETFKNLPLAVKFFIMPYFTVVVVLLLKIIKKSREVFTNFKNDIIFSTNNVVLISKISKLMIGFSIATFSFNSLLISILLLVLCEIFKSGTALQEEHDFTV